MIPSGCIYAVTGVWVVCLALYYLLTTADLFRRVMAANILGAGVFLVLVALARRAPEGPPDPVPHAMVLTGIVVAVSATALLLNLVSTVLKVEAEPEETSKDTSS